MTGAQVSGFYNHTTKDVDGVQIAGFLNIAQKNVDGGQIAGFMNISGKNINGIQLSGFSNYSHKDNNGIQISSFINRAKTQKGLQIALVNLSDTSSGVSFGLFNHVRKGYRAIELTGDEVFYSNLTYKTGNRKLYNIYNLGLRSIDKNIWSYGFGFGSYFKLGSKFSISLDLTANTVQEEHIFVNNINLLNKLSLSLDIKASKNFAFFVGSSYNVHLSNAQNIEKNNFITDIAYNPFFTSSSTNTQTQMWVGAKAGIRFLLNE